jgi:hypothetical protein
MVHDELVRTDRPRMYGRSGLDPVLLPWSWAEHKLIAARNYWIATTRPDGRPHSRPVWGVWLDGAFFFSTGSLAAENLHRDPRVTMHLESGTETVIIESVVSVVQDDELVRRVCYAYNEKYDWDLDPEQSETWYRIPPRKAYGWISDDSGLDRGACFHGSVTRWRSPG